MYIYIYVHIERDDVFIHNVHVTKIFLCRLKMFKF